MLHNSYNTVHQSNRKGGKLFAAKWFDMSSPETSTILDSLRIKFEVFRYNDVVKARKRLLHGIPEAEEHSNNDAEEDGECDVELGEEGDEIEIEAGEVAVDVLLVDGRECVQSELKKTPTMVPLRRATSPAGMEFVLVYL